MANVSFHACALICGVFKTNLKDGRKRRGQAFSCAPCRRKREGARLGEGDGVQSENGSEEKGSKRKTIISLLFKFHPGLTVESQVSNLIWRGD